jgi:hypothetical protein
MSGIWMFTVFHPTVNPKRQILKLVRLGFGIAAKKFWLPLLRVGARPQNVVWAL